MSTSADSPLIAVLGLGTMGAPMAANLLKAGFRVRVHNRTRAREEPLAALGAERAASPKDAVAGATATLVCLTDAPDVEAVLFSGEDAAVHRWRPGALLIDCSTISPLATQALAARLKTVHGHWVDAPVSGGPEGAKAATLSIMCGGTAEDFQAAEPILRAIGRTITHVGPLGSGQIAKAVNQVVIAGTYQALAEGLAFAAKSGADPTRVVQAIQGGAARSWVLEHRSGHMLADRYPLGFKLALHAKDLRIALEAAEAVGAALPLTALVAAAEAELLRAGASEEDVSVLARLARARSGLDAGPYRGA